MRYKKDDGTAAEKLASLAKEHRTSLLLALDALHGSGQGPRDLRLRKKPGKGEILAALREFEGRLPVDFKLDREAANER
jgi:hypothetical protein